MIENDDVVHFKNAVIVRQNASDLMCVGRLARPGRAGVATSSKFESKPTYVAGRRGVGATARADSDTL